MDIRMTRIALPCTLVALATCSPAPSPTTSLEQTAALVEGVTASHPSRKDRGVLYQSQQGAVCAPPVHLMLPTPPSNGGRTTGTLDIQPVFWTSSVAADTQSKAQPFLSALVTNPNAWWHDLLTEYMAGLSTTNPVTVDTPRVITPHYQIGNTATTAQIQAELNWQIANFHLAASSASSAHLFVVFFPSSVTPLYNGVAACTAGTGSWCGYHNTLGGTQATFAVIPDHVVTCGNSANFCESATNSFDAMTAVVSHEVAEAATDPDVASGFLVRSPVDTKCLNTLQGDDEIGDVCAGQTSFVTAGSNTFAIQNIWSNRANACVSSVGAVQDVNGDGRSDLLVTGGTALASSGGIPIATANPDGTYSGLLGAEVVGDTGFTGYANQVGALPITGDFDGDGHSDMALIGPPSWATIPVAFSNTNGFPQIFTGTNSSDGGFHSFYQFGFKPVTGDFYGYGRSGIALIGPPGWHSIPLALSDGDGTFSVTNVVNGDGGFHSFYQTGFQPVAGDFNCDGRSDIALVGVPNWTSIPLALSNGDGTFTVTNVVNGDGNFHIYYQSGVRAVALNGCPAKIALIGPPGWATIPVATAQLNGTFTVTNGSDGGFHVFYQAGYQAVAGDFNGDGNGDIALTGVIGWATMPIAFGQTDGSFVWTNHGETSGDTSFPSSASGSGTKALSE